VVGPRAHGGSPCATGFASGPSFVALPTMARRTSAPALEIFPFLAVLICTMGALILLLLAMTQRNRLIAFAKARAAMREAAVVASDEPPEETGPTQAELSAIEREERRRRREAEWQRQLAELALRRDREREAVMESERDAADAEQKLRESQERLKKSQLRMAALETEHVELTEDEKKLLAAQEQTGDRVALTQRRLERLKQQQAAAPMKYALVPYDGASGTTRRPLYVECIGKGLRILPEDEFLGPEELDGFTSNYNPLLVALKSLSDHWQSERAGSNDPREPYIMLLVRPSGSVSYYVARKMIAGLRIPFGYELIEEDWPIDLPKADPEAKRLVRGAIVATLSARADVLRSMAAASGGRTAASGDLAAARGMVPAGSAQAGRSGSGPMSGSPGQPHAAGLAPPIMTPPPGIGVRRGVGSDGASVTLSDEFTDDLDRLRRHSGGAAAAPAGVALADQSPQPFVEPQAAKGIEPRIGTPKNQAQPTSAVPTTPSNSAVSSVGGGSVPRPNPAGPSVVPRQPQAASGVASQPSPDGTGSYGPNARRGWHTNLPPGAEPNDGGGDIGLDDDPVAKRSAGRRDTQIKKNWGTRGSRNGIGLEKKFDVQVHADRLVMAGGDIVIPAGRGESRDELAGQMAQAISALERSWGRPPANFYWIPAVHFVVHPGGNQHYERLHPKLREWGVYSTVDYELGKTRP